MSDILVSHIAEINARTLKADDRVLFRRGGVWTGGLVINASGVMIGCYGEGPAPIIQNPNGYAIQINGDRNTVQDLGVTNSGIGILLAGQHNTVTRFFARDMNLVRNTPAPNDDYGAVGVVLANSYNEVSYSRFTNCKAPSLDYGYDGGAVEWWRSADYCSVHHSWAENCVGFFEAGGLAGDHALHNTLSYNVSLNNGHFSGVHMADSFGLANYSFTITNNTIIEQLAGGYLFGFTEIPNEAQWVVGRNIFSITGTMQVSAAGTFLHRENAYQLADRARVGYALDVTEMAVDPLFVDLAGKDFRLQAGSPCAGMGAYS